MSKLSCNIVRDLLPLYADGVLEKESMVEVEEHLAECKACKELYDTMNRNVFLAGKQVIQEHTPELKQLLQKIKMRNWIIVGMIAVLLILFFAPMWEIPTEDVVLTKVYLEKKPNEWEPDKEDIIYLMLDYEYDLYSGMHMRFDTKGEELFIKGYYSIFSVVKNWGHSHSTSGSYGQPVEDGDDIKTIYFNGDEIWNLETGEIKKD